MHEAIGKLTKMLLLQAHFPLSLAEERKRGIRVWGNYESRI